MNARRRLLGLAACLLPVTACATTIDRSLEVASTTATTTTTLPVGSAAELLPRLVDEAADMSRRILESDDDRQALERIQALWEASRAEVARTLPELLGSFDGQISMIERAVQFNRPADADKAYRNLVALVDTVLA
jgi:hypothetical protein